MCQIALLIAMLFTAENVNALLVYMPNPVYLYTVVTQQDIPAAPGQLCKLTIYEDVYSGAPPIIRQGMVCVGNMY
jgi:hypothetical protein